MPEQEHALIVSYLGAMERGDLEAVCECFTAAGKVRSPVYGDVPVHEFYRKLFDDTVAVKVDLKTVYRSVGSDGRWAAHFHYRWERRDSRTLETDLVDLFQITDGKIAHLQIVFSASPA